MWFIDWLKVTQEYPQGGLPVVGKEMIARYDLQSGEMLSESPNMCQVEGSYSSILNVRCDGFRITVDGNPSRFHRLDNLFGFTTFDECVAVYNTILNELDLPHLTKCTGARYLSGREGEVAKLAADGAVIKRVDWTKNFAVGKGNTLPFLRALSSQSAGLGKLPNLYSNGKTVEWANGSEWWYQKVYEKAEDFRKSFKKLMKKGITPEDEAYLRRLNEHCDEEGILRVEKEFKRKFLERKNLCYYGVTKETDFEKHLSDIANILERLEMSTVDYETIKDQLLEKRIVKTAYAASRTESYVLAWLHGKTFTNKSSAYYEHKRRLLQLGIDISIPHDVTKMAPQIRNQRTIFVKDALPPSWYKMPKVRHLKLVA